MSTIRDCRKFPCPFYGEYFTSKPCKEVDKNDKSYNSYLSLELVSYGTREVSNNYRKRNRRHRQAAPTKGFNDDHRRIFLIQYKDENGDRMEDPGTQKAIVPLNDVDDFEKNKMNWFITQYKTALTLAQNFSPNDIHLFLNGPQVLGTITGSQYKNNRDLSVYHWTGKHYYLITELKKQ